MGGVAVGIGPVIGDQGVLLEGEAGDILDPDDKVYLGAVPGCFDLVEGLTGDLGGFNLLVDAEFRLALGVIVVVFRKFRVYTHIDLTSLFIRVGFQARGSVAVATIPSGEAVKAPGGALHGTNSDRIVVLALGLDRLTCIQRDSPDPLRWDPPWLSKRAPLPGVVPSSSAPGGRILYLWTEEVLELVVGGWVNMATGSLRPHLVRVMSAQRERPRSTGEIYEAVAVT